ncbi:MAG TPA: cell wall-binding repeat-containing protein, partial [Nitriliruptorales bacterium]|nr:cell wall-binding repeat-containing protein [Nitriliruptorales bacterium]
MHTRRSWPQRVPVALLGILVTVTLALATSPSLALPAAELDLSARLAGGWIADQVGADGSVPGFGGGPDVGATVQAALGMAAADVGADEFQRALGYVKANAEGYVRDGEARDRPGALAYLVLLADAAGEDPRAFGGTEPEHDLVQRLHATRRTTGGDAGLHGAQDPSADGVFRQSLALLALHAAGQQPAADATRWLVDQQCAGGGFPPHRPPPRDDDTCRDLTPDTNSTALAVQALAALATPTEHDALAYLASVRNDDGGFGFDPTTGTDANSTALVIQALLAAGQDPSSGPWADAEQDMPSTALRALQLGCEAPPADRGAFAFQPDEDGGLTANGFATYQAAWGVARAVLPFGDRTPLQPAPDADCPDLAVDRHAGATRVETSALLAREAHPGGAATVVIAFAYGYADALTGAPLARRLDAPVLLNPTERLHDAIAVAVNDLGARTALLLGGTAVLSEQVEGDLLARTSVTEVERIAGPDRFATAGEIARRVGGDHVYVAEGADADPGRGWPDALSVGPLAAHQASPILLVTTGQLPAATRAALEGKRSATVVG